MTSTFTLARRLGRIASIQRTCIRLALRDSPGIEPEWYYFLHSIHEHTEVRKTDIISINLLMEPTTGIDILNRMIKAGLLDEKEDPADRRARLLRLTKKGQNILKKAEQQVETITTLLYNSIPPIQQKAMEDAFAAIENQFVPLLTGHRPKTLAELRQLAANPKK